MVGVRLCITALCVAALTLLLATPLRPLRSAPTSHLTPDCAPPDRDTPRSSPRPTPHQPLSGWGFGGLGYGFGIGGVWVGI